VFRSLRFTVKPFSLSLYRHPSIYILFSSRFTLGIPIDKNFVTDPLINSWLIRLSVDNVLLIKTRSLSIVIDKPLPLSIGTPTLPLIINNNNIRHNKPPVSIYIHNKHPRPPLNRQYTRRLDPSVLSFSLSLHRRLSGMSGLSGN
jgi:hypothetical protein